MVKAEHAGLVVSVESGDDSAPEDNSVNGSDVLAGLDIKEIVTITCLWCKQDVNFGEDILKTCPDHSYHQECVENWLVEHKNCPTCLKEYIRIDN